MAKDKEKYEKELKIKMFEKEEEIKKLKLAREDLQKEVDTLKADYKSNMANVKLMEMELEERLNSQMSMKEEEWRRIKGFSKESYFQKKV